MLDGRKQALWSAIRNRDYSGAFRVLRDGSSKDPFCPQSFFAPESGDPSGSNLLHVAVEAGDTHCARLLLNSGGREWVGRPDAEGRNVFHRIALRDDWKMLFVFREVPGARSLLADQDAQGRTPLHYVALRECEQSAIGGRMNEAWSVRDNEGKLAEDYAKSSGKESLRAVLRQLRKNWEWREKERMRRTHEGQASRSQRKTRSAPPKRAAQPPAESQSVGEANPFAGLESPGDFEAQPAKSSVPDESVPASTPASRRRERRPVDKQTKPVDPPQPATNQMEMFS